MRPEKAATDFILKLARTHLGGGKKTLRMRVLQVSSLFLLCPFFVSLWRASGTGSRGENRFVRATSGALFVSSVVNHSRPHDGPVHDDITRRVRPRSGSPRVDYPERVSPDETDSLARSLIKNCNFHSSPGLLARPDVRTTPQAQPVDGECGRHVFFQ